MRINSVLTILLLLCTLNCFSDSSDKSETSAPQAVKSEKEAQGQKSETKKDFPDFYETLAKRRSVRAYEDWPVESEKIKRISEAINSAPSAGNLQAYEVVLVTDKKILKQLADTAMRQNFVAESQATFVFFANPARSAARYGERGKNQYALQDATIAATHAHLAATAEGLGSCFIGAFNEKAVSSLLKAPEGLAPVLILPVGYPAETPKPRPRRALDDIIKKEHF